jgi:chlorite dismutase
VRIESCSPIPSSKESPGGFSLRGVVQHLHYTSRSDRSELEKVSRSESDASVETMAVLIPIGKSADWWKLSQDERQILFQKTPRHEGHIGIGRKYAGRIFRRLYHSRYIDPAAPHDFLTYFEFDKANAADFRKMLSELRDIKNNPEWLYVDFEYEIWMTKRSLSSEQISREPVLSEGEDVIHLGAGPG